jgi:hypothetical protein
VGDDEAAEREEDGDAIVAFEKKKLAEPFRERGDQARQMRLA